MIFVTISSCDYEDKKRHRPAHFVVGEVLNIYYGNSLMNPKRTSGTSAKPNSYFK